MGNEYQKLKVRDYSEQCNCLPSKGYIIYCHKKAHSIILESKYKRDLTNRIMVICTVLLLVALVIVYCIRECVDKKCTLDSFLEFAYQILLALVSGFVIYFITVVVVEYRRYKRINELLRVYIEDAASSANRILMWLIEYSVEGIGENVEVNRNNVELINKVDFGRKTDVLDIYYIKKKEHKHLFLGQLLSKEIEELKSLIIKIISSYQRDIPLVLLYELEELFSSVLCETVMLDIFNGMEKIEFDKDDRVFSSFYDTVLRINKWLED